MNKTIHYRHLLLFAAAMALGTSFTACSSDDAAAEGNTPTVAADIDAVSFDAYTQRATTRAGHTGAATTAELKNTDDGHLGKAGFGVFAYYTDNFDYTPLYQPNFMYNEHVKWDGTSAFKYDVTKYWPNEHGSQAVSADQDRVSFFAYLPYVEVDPSTGMIVGGAPKAVLDPSAEELQWGITGMKRNTLQGDPIIQYIASFDQSKSVDLCWATTGSSDITWSTNGTTQTIKGGYPWLNVRKPSGVVSDDARIRFNFQHATAKLAVNVKTDFTDGWTPTVAAKTKVWVRSIRFTGIAQKAALNLNNPKTLATNKARWMDYYGTNELELGESVTIHDGRKDGSEGVADAIAPNEAILGLNPQIVQNEGQIVAGAWKTSGEGTRTGVTSSDQSVFCDADEDADYVHVIPTGEKVNVEIVYDIETIDSKLPEMLSDGETQGSSVENRITKAVSFGTTSKFESGKAYTINLILGMKDVQFTAEVSDDWDAVGESDVYLPNNLPEYAAVPTASATNITAITDGSLTTYQFMVTGMEPGETLTGTAADRATAVTIGSTYGGTDGKANANGQAYVSATVNTAEVLNLAANSTTDITVAGASKSVKIDLAQTHQPLGLVAPATQTSQASYTYTATGITTAANWQVASTDATPVSPYVRAWIDGVELTKVDLSPSEGQFSFSNGTLTLNSAPGNGKKITITIKTGDAAAETVSFTVTGS